MFIFSFRGTFSYPILLSGSIWILQTEQSLQFSLCIKIVCTRDPSLQKNVWLTPSYMFFHHYSTESSSLKYPQFSCLEPVRATLPLSFMLLKNHSGFWVGVFFPSGFLSLYFFPCGHFLILGTRNWKNENSNYVAGHRHHGLSRENRDECCVVRTLPNGSHRSHFWSTRCNNIDGGFSFN